MTWKARLLELVILNGKRFGLERNIVMLLPRVLQLLVPQLPETQRNPFARRMRVDHLVDEAFARGHERVGEAVFIFLGALGDLFGVTDVGAEDDLHRALGTHHRDFGGRPGVVEVTA